MTEKEEKKEELPSNIGKKKTEHHVFNLRETVTALIAVLIIFGGVVISSNFSPLASGSDDYGGGGDATTPNPTPTPTPTPPPSPTPTPTPDPTPDPTLNPDPQPEAGQPSAETPDPTPTPDAGGTDADSDDGSIVKVVADQIKDSFESTKTIVAEVKENIKKVIDTPTGSVATKTISTIGAVGGGFIAASTLFANPLSVGEIFLLPLRLWGLLLTAFGLKKRRPPWGVVYDSITKQPLDPAYVSLQDLNGKEVTSSITDLDGRYGFLETSGKYKIVVNKTNYTFPSKKLAGKSFDELYDNLYFGEELDTEALGGILKKNIPLDPVKFDWNEFEKGKRGLMYFYNKHDKLMRSITNALFIFGFFVAIVALFAAPQPYNVGIFGLYILLLVLRIVGVNSKSYGTVKYEEDGEPLSFAIIKVVSAETNTEIMKKVTDRLGRYFALVPHKGDYYIKIDKKNPDESYTEVYKSPVMKISNGILDKEIKIA